MNELTSAGRRSSYTEEENLSRIADYRERARRTGANFPPEFPARGLVGLAMTPG
jgi:hypothetical protein